MLKGSMRAAAIVVAVVATMLAGFAGTASASAPTPNRVTTNVVFDNTGTLVLSFLAQDFLAGDCYIFGPTSGQIAQVILTRPDAAGHNSIRWLAYVGTSPEQVSWITGKDQRNAMDLFAEGKADAFVGYAQEPAELRLRKAGHVIVDTAQDRPWSQYFCCMVVANRDFAQRNPIATKRALRAILKAADVCAAEPERVARFLAAKLYEPRYPIGLEVMKRAQYSRWHRVPE